MSRNWLIEAARHAGLTDSGTDSLELAGLSAAEAWALVGQAFGVTPEALAGHVAAHFALELADFEGFQPRALRRVPEKFARRYEIFPLRETSQHLVVATCDPMNFDTEYSLAFASGLTPVFQVAPPGAIREAIKHGYSPEASIETLLRTAPAVDRDTDRMLEEIRPETLAPVDTRDVDDAPVVRLANLIIHDAVTRRASDIHIGPGPGGGAVRFRIDGVLQDYLQMPIPALNRVVSRIKIIGNLDITDRHRPQDGRTRVHVNEQPYDLRISTVPTRESENAVIRILDPKASTRFRDLAFPTAELDRFRQLLSHRDGIVIVTGPTGSGKTTTLYAGIRELATGDVNIMTVEDPVEYELPGVTQIQVEAERNVTFASSLRAILRQDPDVIFVGEIRDQETAQVAVQASTTGHLVLATLHTNSALGIIPRLAELGLDVSSIESTLRGALAQRLVRRVCPRCAKVVSDDPTPEEAHLSARYRCPPTVRAVGCDHCLMTGYRGRIPVAEIFSMDFRLQELVARGATTQELERSALASGMRPMLQAALDRVRAGETTLAEVSRVLGQVNEETVAAEAPSAAVQPAAVVAPSVAPSVAVTRPESTFSSVSADAGPVARREMAPVSVGPFDFPRAAPAPAAPVEAVPEPVVASAEDEEPETAAEPAPPAAPRILIVDDDPQTRRYVRALLEHHDFDVTEARNGNAALEILKAGEIFSLMLLDLNMPKLGGQEVLAVLRSSGHAATLPVVVLTAANGNSEINALDGGAADFVSKPIVPERLIARIRANLRRVERTTAS